MNLRIERKSKINNSYNYIINKFLINNINNNNRYAVMLVFDIKVLKEA